MAYGHSELIHTQKISLLKLVEHTDHSVIIKCSGIVAKQDFHAELSVQIYCNDCKEIISSCLSAIQLAPGTLVSNIYPIMRNVVGATGICLKAMRKEGDNGVYADQAVILMQNMKIRTITKDEFKEYFLIRGIHPSFIDYKYNEDYIQSNIKSGIFDFLK